MRTCLASRHLVGCVSLAARLTCCFAACSGAVVALRKRKRCTGDATQRGVSTLTHVNSLTCPQKKEKKAKRGEGDKEGGSSSDDEPQQQRTGVVLKRSALAGGTHAALSGGALTKQYLSGVALPSSSDSDSEGEEALAAKRASAAARRMAGMGLHADAGSVAAATAKDDAKARKREMLQAQKVAMAKQAALTQDDTDAFTVRLAAPVGDSGGAAGDDDAGGNAKDVKVEGMSVAARGKVLLDNASFTLVAGRRYGLVGPNGKGKSTLLKLIGWRKVPVPAHMDVLMVEQEVVGSNDTTALQAVVAADTVLMALREEEAELKATLARLESGEDGAGGRSKAAGAEDDDADDVAAQLGDVYQRLAEHGSGGAEARAAKILAGLGFSDAMQKRVTGSFSGGWRMRISLARALYVQPTLLLLDEVRAAVVWVFASSAAELSLVHVSHTLPSLRLCTPAQPTNHLDLRAVLWLEEYLQRWKKTLVVVSHDREFLNNVCTDIIHLHDLKLTSYRGSFAQFEEMYEQRRREANKAFEKYEKQLKAAKATSSKAKIEKVQAGAKQKAEQQAAKKGGKHGGGGGSDEEGGAKADAPRKWSDYTVSFAFPEPTELPPPLLSLSDCCFKYPGREDFGLVDVSCGLDMGSRVAIVGPNGAGKSTLLNLIAGDLEPTSGESRRSQKLRIGRYSQHFVDILAYDENPVEYLMRMHPTANLKPETARALLGRFGLEGHNHLTPIIKLSGGQKARVVFASICLSQPHMLLLDEARCAVGCACGHGIRPAVLCLCCACRAHSFAHPSPPPRSPPTTWICRALTRWATRWRSSRAAWC